jgi:hypothetical protein
MPIAGLACAATIVVASLSGAAGRPGWALALLAAAPFALTRASGWATRHGVLALPTERRGSTNLVGTRGSDAPRVWLVAHLDSKSQPVPMLARVAGVAGSGLAWGAAVTVAAAQLIGVPVTGAWNVVAIVGVAAALPVIGSVIGNRSPGALDNASGVVTVLLAAAGELDVPALPENVGVLLTSGEELGLAGARAWARGARPTLAINVDSVDDRGPLAVLTRGGVSPAMRAALAREPGVVVRRVPPGVLVDGIALADAGFDTLTVSQGTLATLARIHTPRDTLAALGGANVIGAARLVRRLAMHALCDG